METTMLEERVIYLEEREVRMSAILHDLSTLCQNLQKKSGDKTSPSGDKTSPTHPPRLKSGDFLSPQCLEWSQPWKPIVGPVFKPAKSFWDFEKRYLCRPEGPTKYISQAVELTMAYPENKNFYVKSKRCYVCKNKKWEQVKPADFYPVLRQKILAQYHNLLLRSQHKKVEKFATDCVARGSLNHWTNQKMEAMFSSRSP